MALHHLDQLKGYNVNALKSVEVLLLQDLAKGAEELSSFLATIRGGRLKWLALPWWCTRMLSRPAWWKRWLPPTYACIAMLACPQLVVFDMSRCVVASNHAYDPGTAERLDVVP